ncbi:DNA polymerase [Candidatus Neomarinimicrobiota bacterium]
MDVSRITREILYLPESLCRLANNLGRGNRERTRAYFIILALVMHRGEVSSSFACEIYRQKYRRTDLSPEVFKKYIRRLLDGGWIERMHPSGIERGSIYRIAQKAKSDFPDSGLFYPNVSDALNHNNGISLTDVYQQYYDAPLLAKQSEPERLLEWQDLLLPEQETSDFINGLDQLQSYRYIFRRDLAVDDLSYPVWHRRTLHLPPNIFKVIFRALRSGRLQSIPHTYVGKKVLPYLRPESDPDLQDGFLISFDYSDQELRLLAQYCKDHLLYQWAQSDERLRDKVFNALQTQLPMEYRKIAVYAVSYGSEGYAIFDAMIDDRWELGMTGKEIYAISKRLVKDIQTTFPGMDQFHRSLMELFMRDNQITAPGGAKRIADPEKGNDSGVCVSEKRARRIALSHYIQGAGAWITRKIVTGAVDLRYARLFMPIHDGFIFYIPKDHVEVGLDEARTLMRECAGEVAPDVVMPFKIEWAAFQNQPAYSVDSLAKLGLIGDV